MKLKISKKIKKSLILTFISLFSGSVYAHDGIAHHGGLDMLIVVGAGVAILGLLYQYLVGFSRR